MNRKIQETDSTFIIARYLRDHHAFNAREEAAKYDVSLRTIYNVLAQAGIKMRRGRKPIQAPPAPLISASDAPKTPISPEAPPFETLDVIVASAPLLKPPVGPKPPLSPKPPITVRRGPPVIRPKAR